MAIRVKVAKSAIEIDDVLKVRHQSYVIEDGKFGGQALPRARITDRFDAMPGCANIIAYDGDIPVGTIRVNLDTGAGLPSEEYYDFSHYRQKIEEESQTTNKKVILASGGMFAILEKWQRKRNVVFAIMRMGVGVYHSWGVTHVVATSNHETVSVYKHLGFEEYGEAVWVEEIGNSVVPMVAPFERLYDWAFGRLINSSLDDFWLSTFSEHFERLLLAPGEVLFSEGDVASHAFIIDDGWISITRKDPEGEELTLATLSKGDLFGELAMIDNLPRSGAALAENSTELICLDREKFLQSISGNSELLEKLLYSFVQRIRRTDDLAMVMAFAPQTTRVEFALKSFRKTAKADPKRPGVTFVRLGPQELAKTAGVREPEVRRVLEKYQTEGQLEYGNKIIRFFG